MSTRAKGTAKGETSAGVAALERLSEAVESGAGLPAIARAAASALDASVALIDRSSAVLAVAARSSDEEGKLLGGGEGIETLGLRVADARVGELRYRPRGERPSPTLIRMVSTLLALELERARAPEWASDEAAGEFVRAVLERRVTDRGDIVARAAELGAEVEGGGGVLVALAAPRAAQPGDWRSRVLVVALRALRAASSGAIAALGDRDEQAQVSAIVPTPDAGRLERAAQGLAHELSASLPGFRITVARSRWAGDPADIYRAGQEALLAANVAEAEGIEVLGFEQSGSYRLLLGAMSEGTGELERFYEETVARLAAYDEQYETELVTTIEAYLANDGNVTPTAQQLFTHRHTVRYRLERVRELSGHDITSTDGRERLSLGLKAMRVLGISPPRGPALEPGTEAGRAKVRGKGGD
jgi:hypothetical protein